MEFGVVDCILDCIDSVVRHRPFGPLVWTCMALAVAFVGNIGPELKSFDVHLSWVLLNCFIEGFCFSRGSLKGLLGSDC